MLAPPPTDSELGLGFWVFLAAVVVVLVLAFRYLSRAGERRLAQRGRGPETEQDREKKRDERDARKKRELAEPEELVGDDSAAQPADAEKKDKKKKGKKTEVEPEPPKEPEKPALLLPPEGKSFGEGLRRTRQDGFIGKLGKLFAGKAIDEALLEKVEEVLFTADIGVRTSTKLLDGLKREKGELAGPDGHQRVWAFLRREAQAIFEAVPGQASLPSAMDSKPHVVLVIGVNGSGKTTTIGKLSHRLIRQGKKVVIGAGDTFRAAAVDQLGIWAKRVGAEVVEGKEGSDPSSVLFDAVKRGSADGADVVICDTAGRLHTHTHLLEELKKVKRVISKAQAGAPHEVLLVLDATNGQNAIAQAHIFGQELGVTGIVLTKLDGTAKGGVVLGIVDELKLPVQWVGIGERTEDLRPFDAAEFVSALFEQGSPESADASPT